MENIENVALEDCRPWETRVLFNNTNLLNNFKQNLHCYEEGFRKFTIKSKCELPQIIHPPKPRTLISQNKLGELQRIPTVNKSSQIQKKQHQHKNSNGTLIKYNKNDEFANKQNKEEPCTERHRYKEDFKTKIFLINFEEQIKYKRMKKRQIHHVIFGDRSKNRKSKQCFQ